MKLRSLVLTAALAVVGSVSAQDTDESAPDTSNSAVEVPANQPHERQTPGQVPASTESETPREQELPIDFDVFPELPLLIGPADNPEPVVKPAGEPDVVNEPDGRGKPEPRKQQARGKQPLRRKPRAAGQPVRPIEIQATREPDSIARPEPANRIEFVDSSSQTSRPTSVAPDRPNQMTAAELRQARALYRSAQRIRRLEMNAWMGYEPLRPNWTSIPSMTSRYPARNTIYVPVYIYPN